jgi:hypothetical protein
MLAPPSCASRIGKSGFDICDHVHDGAIEHRRTRHSIGPCGTWRVHRCQVPQYSRSHTAFLNRLRLARVRLYPPGERMIGVPILPHACVREARENGCGGCSPIGWQHRLPDRVHAKVLAARLQQRLDCGSPPQTRASSRREQNDDTRLSRFAIELVPERVE